MAAEATLAAPSGPDGAAQRIAARLSQRYCFSQRAAQRLAFALPRTQHFHNAQRICERQRGGR